MHKFEIFKILTLRYVTIQPELLQENIMNVVSVFSLTPFICSSLYVSIYKIKWYAKKKKNSSLIFFGIWIFLRWKKYVVQSAGGQLTERNRA